MLRNVLAALLLGAVLVLTAGTAVAAYLLATPHGARWVALPLLSRRLEWSRLSVGELTGNLLQGLVARQVTLADVKGRTVQARSLAIERIQLSPLLRTGGRAAFQMDGLRAQEVRLRATSALLVRAVEAARFEGRWTGRAAFFDVQVDDIHGLPAGTRLDIQRVDASLPVGIKRINAIHNGRLRLPYSAPILLFGTQRAGRFDVRVSCQDLDIGEILALVPRGPSLAGWTGTIGDLQFSLSGSARDFTLSGRFLLAALSRKGVSLTHCPAEAALTLTREAHRWRMSGSIEGRNGIVTSKQARLHVHRGTLTFTGSPALPAFHVMGSAVVKDVKIHVTLRGTPVRPEVRLTSDPPLPQDTLLVMLATGKRWKSPQEAVSEGEISSDAATAFIDYFFFGGSGSRLARQFGISDVSLRHSPDTRRLGVEATFVDKMTLGFEMEPSPEAGGADGSASEAEGDLRPYKVGAAYQVTEDTLFAVEGEQVLREPRRPIDPTGHPRPPQADQTILWKLKRRF